MTMKLYWRCNGGHYISSNRRCPWDGWTSPDIEELCSVAGSIAKQGKDPTIAALREAKVSDRALQRAIVVDFGDDRAAFEALMPQEYILNGKPRKMGKLPRELM